AGTVLGVALSFAFALGILQFAGRSRHDLGRTLVDTADEGLIAVENDGSGVYYNDAYLALADRLRSDDLPGPPTIERLFNGAPEIAEAVYRLAQAAREGRAAAEEIRVVPQKAARSGEPRQNGAKHDAAKH